MALGDKTYSEGVGLTLKSNQAFDLITALDALVNGPGTILGRYDIGVPLTNDDVPDALKNGMEVQNMGVCNAAVFKLVPQEVPQAVGGAAGWGGGLGALGGFVIPPVMGFAVRDLGTRPYAIGFIVFVFLALFGLSIVWVLKYTREAPALAGQLAPAPETQNRR